MLKKQIFLVVAAGPLVLFLATAIQAQPEYDVVNLHPSGAESSFALRVSNGQQVGDSISGACLWFGTAESVVDLEPPGYEWCEACDVSNGQQVGGGGMETDEGHALLWYGSADSVIDLHPSGFDWSICEGVGDGQQVGYGIAGLDGHALLWEGSADSVVNLHPSGFLGSWAIDAADGQQVGAGFLELTDHALLWSGTSGSVVDLHPSGFVSSMAQGVGDGQQVGWGFTAGGVMHALLWSGSAGSVVDLHPSGFEGSEATDASTGYQVGTGWFPGGFQGQGYALLWSGTAESVVNLHSFLPSEYVWSRADGIDSTGCIVGVARTETTGHAVMWVPRNGEPPDPLTPIEEILLFIAICVEDGTLAGDGPGNSGENRLNALVNMLEEAQRLIDEEMFEEAYGQLRSVYRRTDGESPPPDFVTGEEASELATLILELMESLVL